MSNEEHEERSQPELPGNKWPLCLRILSTNPTRTTRQQPVIYQCECLKRISESSSWSVRLSDFDEIHMEAIVMECRSWRSERRKALGVPARSHEDIETKDGAIILTNDPLILEHSGDAVYWLNKDNIFIPDPTVFFWGSSFNDGTTQTALDPLGRGAGSHPLRVQTMVGVH